MDGWMDVLHQARKAKDTGGLLLVCKGVYAVRGTSSFTQCSCGCLLFITQARLLESLVRMTEARAKVDLRAEATRQDAQV
jgi:hypothetical protein